MGFNEHTFLAISESISTSRLTAIELKYKASPRENTFARVKPLKSERWF